MRVPSRAGVTHLAIDTRPSGPVCGSTRLHGWPKLTNVLRDVTCKACLKVFRSRNPSRPSTKAAREKWRLEAALASKWPEGVRPGTAASQRSDARDLQQWGWIGRPDPYAKRTTRDIKRGQQRTFDRASDKLVDQGSAAQGLWETRRMSKPRLPNISSRVREAIVAYLIEHGWTIVGKHVLYAYVPGRDPKYSTVRYRIDRDVQGQERLRRGWVNIEKMSLDAALAKLGRR